MAKHWCKGLLALGLSSFACAALAASGSDDMTQLPAELKAFIAPQTKAIYFALADLDGDQRSDALLVLEPELEKPKDEAYVEAPARTLLLLRRGSDGQLREAKRNDKLVYCATCGGVMGDPFQGIEVGPKTFSVSHYGGSSWRWTAEYQFNYSRKDDTWQLVRVEESQFHASEPDKLKQQRYKPPKDFGKIDLADFDPEHWKGQGPK